MDLRKYVAPLIRWWWLILLASLVSMASSYWIVRQQPPIYSVRTTLIVGQTVYQPNPNPNDLWLNQQLAAFYADIGNRQQIRSATQAALGLDWLPAYVIRQQPNSQLIEIIVTDIVPLRAQVVANELANQLIKQSPTNSLQQNAQQSAFISQQLDKLQADITETEDLISAKSSQLATLNSAQQIADTQAEIAGLQSKLAQLQSNFALLLSNTRQGANNTLSVIEPATLPTFPIGPNKPMIVLLSMAIGGLIAAGAAYLLDYLDDTVKTSDDVTQALDLPTVGHIGRMAGTTYAELLIAQTQPLSQIVNDYRALRTNLQFSSVDKPLQTLVVTSASPQEGKTVTVANLAVVLAQAGARVIVVDADLRRPSLHKMFDGHNLFGLSDLALDSSAPALGLLQDTAVENLRFLASGTLPPRSADLIGSERMATIIHELREDADLVLFDSPPCLAVSDATILAARTDGVLFVVDWGRTRTGDARRVVEELRRVRANIIGVVLNRQTARQGRKYVYYTATANEEVTARSRLVDRRLPVGDETSDVDVMSEPAPETRAEPFTR